jgi:hypothetical protein
VLHLPPEVDEGVWALRLVLHLRGNGEESQSITHIQITATQKPHLRCPLRPPPPAVTAGGPVQCANMHSSSESSALYTWTCRAVSLPIARARRSMGQGEGSMVCPQPALWPAPQ